MKRTIYGLVLGLVVGAFLLLGKSVSAADGSGGQIICNSQYALCSSAQCHPIAGASAHVTCDCQGPMTGANIGDSSCKDRSQALTSTFSLRDPIASSSKPSKQSIACTGTNAAAWAFCLDAPCKVENGKTSCECVLKPASDYYTFNTACPADAAALQATCKQIWSAATLAELVSGYSQLAGGNADPPKAMFCKSE